MFAWLKNLFNPKNLLKQAIDSLDFAAPFLAAEIDKHPEFMALSSIKKAELVIDKVQELLSGQFKIDS